MARGETVTAAVTAKDLEGGAVRIEWVLCREQASYDVDGLGSAATPSYPEAIARNGQARVSLKMPQDGGIYRLYCYVRNTHGGAAVGSLPIKVTGPAARFKPATPKLPLVLVGDGAKTLYIPSGWMGDTKAIDMDPLCTENPHRGKTCLKVTFSQPGGWGGVVWQHPANDWGDKPGGYDLSGAERLTFWARGREGGEKVKFGFGLIGIDKKYHDSAKAEVEVTLAKDWKQYTVDLSAHDLGCIKSGFRWAVGGQGRPVTFYLADVQYE